jgi:hypothetical protein
VVGGVGRSLHSTIPPEQMAFVSFLHLSAFISNCFFLSVSTADEGREGVCPLQGRCSGGQWAKHKSPMNHLDRERHKLHSPGFGYLFGPVNLGSTLQSR